MRYAENHKDETRKTILKVAARELREKGPDRLGVAEVMAAAGLTHGGFYAHFKSKDAFLAEALRTVFAQSRAKFAKAVEGMPAEHALATFIDFYVSPSHRDNPGRGCPIVALNSDLPRQSKAFREAFEAGVNGLTGVITKWMEDAGVENACNLAPSIISAMSGAVSLSRAISDRTLSDNLLETSRDGIKARLGITDAILSKRKH
ncbi:MAG: TetR family transcriptional regulator [Alphaproteobacteria bacterium]|nr:TetR family transcriptional regulator [Alphaproteobacteria bacterium]